MAVVKDAEYFRRWRAARGARTGAHGPAPTAECGTRSGYMGHKRRGEPIDDACRAAYNEAARQRYHATKKLKRNRSDDAAKSSSKRGRRGSSGNS